MAYYVYVLASKRNGTLYIGVTNDLIRRVWEHKEKLAEGFTRRYGIALLVYFEQTDSIEAAIAREKQLKNWHRPWKISLIEGMNPRWEDLYASICGAMGPETSSGRQLREVPLEKVQICEVQLKEVQIKEAQ